MDNKMIRTALVSFAMAWGTAAWAAGGWVYEMTGDVTVAVGAASAVAAQKNTEVTSDTTVTTGDNSTVVLKFEDGQIISMEPNSSMRVNKYVYVPKKVEKKITKLKEEKSVAFFSAIQGGLRFVTGMIGKTNKAAFKLATPTATIGIRGTDGMVKIVKPKATPTTNATTPPANPAPQVYTHVNNGAVSLTNTAGTSVLPAGKTALIASTTTQASVLSGAAAAAAGNLFAGLSSIPIPPSLPSAAPSAPTAPTAPTTPTAPATPSVPSVPSVPATPPVVTPPVVAPPVPVVAPAAAAPAAAPVVAAPAAAAPVVATTTTAAASTTAAAVATGAITTTTVVTTAAVIGAAAALSKDGGSSGTTGTVK